MGAAPGPLALAAAAAVLACACRWTAHASSSTSSSPSGQASDDATVMEMDEADEGALVQLARLGREEAGAGGACGGAEACAALEYRRYIEARRLLVRLHRNYSSLRQGRTSAGAGKVGGAPPDVFTARVQFNGVFPGPGMATFRNITSYWVYDGPGGRERFTSLDFTRSLSSGSTALYTTYDTVRPGPGQPCVEATTDLNTGLRKCEDIACPDRAFNETTSLARFLPSAFTWAAEVFGEPGAAGPLTKGEDVALQLPDGGEVMTEKWVWTGGHFGTASHEVWVDKETGLVVKEAQQQEAGPNPYPASATVYITYDDLMPAGVLDMASMQATLFALPSHCAAGLLAMGARQFRTNACGCICGEGANYTMNSKCAHRCPVANGYTKLGEWEAKACWSPQDVGRGEHGAAEGCSCSWMSANDGFGDTCINCDVCASACRAKNPRCTCSA